MKDNYGDDIVLSHDSEDVSLGVHDCSLGRGVTAFATLSPAKARKLAGKLLRAADEIDTPMPELADVVALPVLDKSFGFADGDVVLLRDVGAVLRYDAEADAWYSAGPESHDCSGDFKYSNPSDVILLESPGRVSW